MAAPSRKLTATMSKGFLERVSAEPMRLPMGVMLVSAPSVKRPMPTMRSSAPSKNETMSPAGTGEMVRHSTSTMMRMGRTERAALRISARMWEVVLNKRMRKQLLSGKIMAAGSHFHTNNTITWFCGQGNRAGEKNCSAAHLAARRSIRYNIGKRIEGRRGR